MSETSAADPSKELAPEFRQLLGQVSWFNRLRFVAVIGMVMATSVAGALRLLIQPLPIYGLAGGALLLNFIYIWRGPSLARASYRRVRAHADLQIGLDLLVLTGVLHYSGGSASPLSFFFLFHTFIAAHVVSVRTGLAVAVASVGLVGGLGVLELTGLLPAAPGGLQLMDIAEVGVVGLLSWMLALSMTLGISVYFVATVLGQVRFRDAELRRLNQQLGQSEKLASIGTLAAGVAHEINNPVGVIRTKTQILRYRIADGDDSTALLNELDTIEKHTDRIGAITKGLLTFSKESAFEMVRLDLHQLVQEAAELVRVPYKDRGVLLRIHIDDQSAMVLGSENHLLQVLVNILLNARDASPAGAAVDVAVRLVGTSTPEAAGHETRWAEVRVEDQGEGIEPEYLGKIFDPFFTTKDVDRGTGLGLSITHGIVERHRGEILVDSERGQGAVFRVRLPEYRG